MTAFLQLDASHHPYGVQQCCRFLTICMSVSANAAWIWIVANHNGIDVNASTSVSPPTAQEMIDLGGYNRCKENGVSSREKTSPANDCWQKRANLCAFFVLYTFQITGRLSCKAEKRVKPRLDSREYQKK
jgi:hypothetical protein